MSTGTVEVFCPVPPAAPGVAFAYVQVRPAPRSIVISSLPHTRCRQLRRVFLGRPRLSAIVPVCKQSLYFPQDQQVGPSIHFGASASPLSSAVSTPPPSFQSALQSPRMALLVCASTGRHARAPLVEWLEHLRLLGTDHVVRHTPFLPLLIPEAVYKHRAINTRAGAVQHGPAGRPAIPAPRPVRRAARAVGHGRPVAVPIVLPRWRLTTVCVCLCRYRVNHDRLRIALLCAGMASGRFIDQPRLGGRFFPPKPVVHFKPLIISSSLTAHLMPPVAFHVGRLFFPRPHPHPHSHPHLQSAVTQVQYTALSSCYSRYRRLARYVMVIDDDEYVALAPRLLLDPTGTTSPFSAPLQPHMICHSHMYMCMGVTYPGRLSAAPLVTYLDGLIGGDALASAVKFLPVAKYRCTNHTQNSRHHHRSSTRRRPGTSASSLGLPRVRPSMHACVSRR
jgi:hypothetical protein